MENKEMNQESQPIEIQIADIVNATRIMEYAISKNVFSVKELAEISPIVVRFQDFVAAVQAQQSAPAEVPAEDAADVSVEVEETKE